MLLLGCIADDFTGAGDAASFLVKGGMRTILWNGIPSGDLVLDENIQAIVIAMKTRTQERYEAVAESMQALHWLRNAGVQTFYIKYCSTFDSTPDGNIGPIMDAALEALDVPCSVLCPSLPVNGRTVKDGILYVDGIPVHESHMRNHPLTPIWDSSIVQLMKPQSKYPCKVVPSDWMKGDTDSLQALFTANTKERNYFVPDFVNSEDGDRIAEVFGGLKLLSGGSGLLESLAKRYIISNPPGAIPDMAVEGKTILLAGSCSKATLEQIELYQNQGGPSYKIDPIKLSQGIETREDIWDFVSVHPGETVLIYSSDTSDHVKEVQQVGRDKIAMLLESTMAALAKKAAAHGYKKFIIAGGETSGAVTMALGFHSYEVGQCVAPGVPVLYPLNQPDVRLVLKSGNFGQKDFFVDSIKMLSPARGV